MEAASQQVFESALLLSESDRAELANRLLESLEPEGREVSSEEFGKELHRRLEAYERGEMGSVSLEEAREAVLGRLRAQAEQ